MPPVERDRPGRPTLWSTLRHYSLAAFAADAAAGATVGLMALPLSIGFAISAGLPPRMGLYGAIVSGLIVSALGGSRVQIAGPTGAGIVLIAGIVSRHGLDGLFLGTMMAGALLIALGATGMGTAMRYIPRPVVVGFTNGLSILIASLQIGPFLGLTLPDASGSLTTRMVTIAQQADRLAWTPPLLGAACLLLSILCLRRQSRVPGAIVVLLLGTLITMMFGVPVETVASRFHGVAGPWPAPHLPAFRFDLAWTLLPSAFAMAMLAAIASLRSAAGDRIGGGRLDANVELVAQGVANVVSPIASGLPSTGALVRTQANVQAGARTPVAGLVHALTLLIILLAAAPLVGQIPLPLLAALLLVVAWQAGGWSELPDVLRMTRTDAGVWLVTFALTVFADLTMAVAAGMALAALLFIRTAAKTMNIAQVTEEVAGAEATNEAQEAAPPAGVAVFRIKGPFLLNGTDTLAGIADRLDSQPPIIILRLRYMTAIDDTGLRAIEALADIVRASGRAFLVSGARGAPAALLARARFHAHLGPENVCATYADALARARRVYRERFQPGFPFGAAADDEPPTATAAAPATAAITPPRQ